MGKKSKHEKHSDDDIDVDLSKSANNLSSLAGTPGGGGAPSLDDKEEYARLCENVNAIAQPLASRKLAKKLYKLIKKANKEKHHLRQGVTDVQRAIRKGERGLVVLAGDVTPVDVYCHIPAVCEETEIPYVFTPSKEHLGLALNHKRPTIMYLIKKNDSYADTFDECFEIVRSTAVV